MKSKNSHKQEFYSVKSLVKRTILLKYVEQAAEREYRSKGH